MHTVEQREDKADHYQQGRSSRLVAPHRSQFLCEESILREFYPARDRGWLRLHREAPPSRRAREGARHRGKRGHLKEPASGSW